MVIDVPATLPDSGTLAPRDIARKFQSTSLAGLGSFCDDFPEECGQVDSVGVSTGGSGGSLDLCSIYPAPGCPGYQTTPYDTTPFGSGTPSGSGSGSDTALLQSLIKAGVDVSKLALVTPGTTLLNNGTVSRQNPGYAIPGSGVGTVGVTGNSTMMLMLVGLGAFMLYSMNKNRG